MNDIRLKTYDELIFEITKLNTDKFLLQKENQQLKEQNEFLIKRENKLQQIEMMFKNRSVDLEELSNLILEGSNE